MRLHVEVTQEDIEQGIRQHPSACMVHCALKRITGKSFSINQRGVNDGHGGLATEWPMPITRKIERWDSGARVRPFAFDLELPDELLTGVSQ